MSGYPSVARFFFFFIFTEAVHLQRYLVVTWLVPRQTAAVSAQVLCTPYNHSPVYSVTSFKAFAKTAFCFFAEGRFSLGLSGQDKQSCYDVYTCKYTFKISFIVLVSLGMPFPLAVQLGSRWERGEQTVFSHILVTQKWIDIQSS